MDYASAVNGADQGVLQLVYDLMSQRGAWPTFTAVDVRVDRDLGVEDAQAALLAIPDGYIARPWQAHGFSDRDEVRLTLRGVAACVGGRQDLPWIRPIASAENHLIRGAAMTRGHFRTGDFTDVREHADEHEAAGARRVELARCLASSDSERAINLWNGTYSIMKEHGIRLRLAFILAATGISLATVVIVVRLVGS